MSDSMFDNENKIRQRIKSVFETIEETKSFANDIAFHMTDWLSDIKDLQDIYSNIENFTNDEIQLFVYSFLAHVPNHLNAAMKLSGIGKVEDVFQVGIFEDDD